MQYIIANISLMQYELMIQKRLRNQYDFKNHPFQALNQLARYLLIRIGMDLIAITFWNGLVSPLFDAAECMLFISSKGRREQVDSAEMSIHGKAELLQRKKTTILICGAISNIALAILKDKNIKVIPWIRGSVEEIIKAYSDGALENKRFFMPGYQRNKWCRKMRHRMNPGIVSTSELYTLFRI